MRFIQKGTEPIEFVDWKNQANECWTPTFDTLSGPVKKSVYDSLLSEQGHICCYCERELIGDDYHIEHLNPQTLKQGDELDYKNLLCSCINQTEKGVPLHCGHKKHDSVLAVHPLQGDCQSKFKYTWNGKIEGIEQDAENTVETLGLNIDKLINMRRKALEPFLVDLDHDDLLSFVSGYIIPNEDGKRNPFCSMIEFLFI